METKDAGFHRKGKPFKDMAHPMETKTQLYRKGKPFENMAHMVDVPEAFKESFIDKILKVGESKTKVQRINNLVSVFIDLRKYMSSLGIEQDVVDNKKNNKADANGHLDEGWIMVNQGVKKLVRDKIHNFPKKDEYSSASFYQAKRDEHLLELDKKFIEEGQELTQDAKTEEKRIEEMADLSEVLLAIIKFRDINPDEVLTRVHYFETKERIKINQARRKLANKK